MTAFITINRSLPAYSVLTYTEQQQAADDLLHTATLTTPHGDRLIATSRRPYQLARIALTAARCWQARVVVAGCDCRGCRLLVAAGMQATLCEPVDELGVLPDGCKAVRCSCGRVHAQHLRVYGCDQGPTGEQDTLLRQLADTPQRSRPGRTPVHLAPLVDAGWIQRDTGWWTVTDAGRTALAQAVTR